MKKKGFPVYNNEGMKIGYFKDTTLDIDNIMFAIQDEIDKKEIHEKRDNRQ